MRVENFIFSKSALATAINIVNIVRGSMSLLWTAYVWSVPNLRGNQYKMELKMNLIGYVIYQTRKTVFDHISKHREESWKYDA